MRVEELLRRARREGWSTALCGSGHWQLSHPEASRAVIVPATPSDYRWHLNALADMRRVLPAAPKVERKERRPKRRPAPPPKPRTLPAIEIEPEELPLPLPSRRLAGGPAGHFNVWSRLW